MTYIIPASGNINGYGNFSCVVSTTPILILPDPTILAPGAAAGGAASPSRRAWHIVRYNGVIGPVFCSRYDPSPAAGKASTFRLLPGDRIEDTWLAGFAPQAPLWAVAPFNDVAIYAEAG